MGPLLRYLVIALFVVLGTSWAISSYQGCAKKDSTSLLNDLDNVDDSDLWEEDLEEGDIADGDMDLSDDPDDLDAEIERLEQEMANENSALASTKPATKTPIKPKAKPVANNSRPTNYSPSKGAQYLVVAGSYSSNPNAKVMANRLKSMGYDGAEVVEFDYSKYISVLAGRYVNEADARALAEELQQDGVEAYVHKKR